MSLRNAALVALGERTVVPLIWLHNDGTIVAFACVDSLWSIDFHPDAATWVMLSGVG